MSSPNRTRLLLGFSAVVAVLIVAIVLWPANVRKEDAAGAIGAVQKHRAPQITQQDVVLGNESVKHQQKVLYTDFLADAAKLRAMAASRDVAAARVFSREVQNRYFTEARAALAEAEVASRTSASRAELQSEIQDLNSRLSNRSELSEADMQSLNSRLAHISELAQQESAMSRLQEADSEMANLASRLSSMNLENEAQAASKTLADVEALLSRSSANISLADEVQYLGMMEMESRVLAESDAAALSSRLSEAAEQLAARAQKNIDEAAALQSEMAARLNSMDEALERASRIVGSRAGIAGSASEMLSRNIASLSQRLHNQEAASREFIKAKELESRQQ